MPEAIEFHCRFGTISGLRWGSGNSKKVLALHGWLDNAASFCHLAPLLAEHGYDVIAIDFPGHGHSDHRAPGHNYLFINYLTDTHEVVEQLPGQDWILLGHSMGAGIGQMYITAYPEKFKHLIMLENLGAIPSYQPDAGPEILKKALHSWQNHNLEHRNHYATIEDAIEARTKVTPMPVEVIRPMIERGLRQTHKGYHWRTDKRLRLNSLYRLTEEQINDYLKATAIPTHLILAQPHTYAMSYPTVTQRIEALKPQWFDYVEGDHHLHMSNTQAVFDIIIKRLQQDL
ncbi:alpha/beta hydrolase [Marinicella sp. W31]|uniref:alpha/beta hydrolase n=1 Tax=Marinicella sp. W31 TaxID=3023713 RepID=UPI003756FC36